MDRFTRTREFYLRGSRNGYGECREVTSAPVSSRVDGGFNFDFAESCLDLRLGIGMNRTDAQPPSSTACLDIPADQIGIAISDDVESAQRARLRKRLPGTVNIPDQNKGVPSVPAISDEVRITFNSREHGKNGRKRSTSIYSKERRQRVTRTIPPPEQTNFSSTSDDTNFDPKMVDSDGKALESRAEAIEAERSPAAQKRLSVLPEHLTQAVASPHSQSVSPDERPKKNKKVISCTLDKIISIAKPWQKRSRLGSTTRKLEDDKIIIGMITPTPESESSPRSLVMSPSGSTSLAGEVSSPSTDGLGGALRARVAEKQAAAAQAPDEKKINDFDHPAFPLRGGGNVPSTSTVYIWEDEEIRRLFERNVQRLPRNQRAQGHPDFVTAGEDVIMFDDEVDLSAEPPLPAPSRRPAGRRSGFSGGMVRNGAMIRNTTIISSMTRSPSKVQTGLHSGFKKHGVRNEMRKTKPGKRRQESGEGSSRSLGAPLQQQAVCDEPASQGQSNPPYAPEVASFEEDPPTPSSERTSSVRRSLVQERPFSSLALRPKAQGQAPRSAVIGKTDDGSPPRSTSPSTKERGHDVKPKNQIPATKNQEHHEHKSNAAIRITLVDGRTLGIEEYQALYAKRAGKRRASSPPSYDASVPPSNMIPSTPANAGMAGMSAMDLLRQSSRTPTVRPSVRRAATKAHKAAMSFLDRIEKAPAEQSFIDRSKNAKDGGASSASGKKVPRKGERPLEGLRVARQPHGSHADRKPARTNDRDADEPLRGPRSTGPFSHPRPMSSVSGASTSKSVRSLTKGPPIHSSSSTLASTVRSSITSSTTAATLGTTGSSIAPSSRSSSASVSASILSSSSSSTAKPTPTLKPKSAPNSGARTAARLTSSSEPLRSSASSTPENAPTTEACLGIGSGSGRPLGPIPAAAPGARPLPVVIQVASPGTPKEGNDAAEPTWSFANLKL